MQSDKDKHSSLTKEITIWKIEKQNKQTKNVTN